MNLYNYLIYVFVYILLNYRKNFVESRYNGSLDDNDKSSEASSDPSNLNPLSKESDDNVENGQISESNFTQSVTHSGTAAPLDSDDNSSSRISEHIHQPTLESEDNSTSHSKEYRKIVDTSDQSSSGAESSSESSAKTESTSEFTLELSFDINDPSYTSSNSNYSVREDENNPNEYCFDFNKGSNCSKITLLSSKIWELNRNNDPNYPKSVVYKKAAKIVVYFDNSIIYFFKSASGSWKDKLLLIQLYGDKSGGSSEPRTFGTNTTNGTCNNSQPDTSTHLVKLDSRQYEIKKTGTGEYKFEFKYHECTEVRLEGRTLWKYDTNNSPSHPGSISYKDDKIIIYFDGTYITFEKGADGLWTGRKFDIELFTKASDDSSTNVGLSESHYELRESGDEFNYEFKSSLNLSGTSESNCNTNSTCTEIKCQNKYIWKQGDHGIQTPLTLSYNKKGGHISIRDDKNVLLYRRDDEGNWKFYMSYPTDTGGIKLYSQNVDGSTSEMDSNSYQLTRDPRKAYILGYSLNGKCTKIKHEVTVPDPNDPTKVTTTTLKVWDPDSSELNITHTNDVDVDSNASSQVVSGSSTQDSDISPQLSNTSGADPGNAEITSPELNTYAQNSTVDNSDEDIFSTLDTSSFPDVWPFVVGSEGSSKYELPKHPTKITFDTKDNVLWVIFDKSYVAYMYQVDKWVEFSLDLYIF
ncbi:hypothetical protein MACK_001053 [Theileria orientalis]|uniref:Uncharacterized protein n=1 Tax=Theileria orientalis TaxID=68886 RepID=A0A976MBS4_THEOR|nr:hypothetical protein MACK_001053 [Theileria orientalis]